jgi:hypothetical protein
MKGWLAGGGSGVMEYPTIRRPPRSCELCRRIIRSDTKTALTVDITDHGGEILDDGRLTVMFCGWECAGWWFAVQGGQMSLWDAWKAAGVAPVQQPI